MRASCPPPLPTSRLISVILSCIPHLPFHPWAHGDVHGSMFPLHFICTTVLGITSSKEEKKGNSPRFCEFYGAVGTWSWFSLVPAQLSNHSTTLFLFMHGVGWGECPFPIKHWKVFCKESRVRNQHSQDKWVTDNIPYYRLLLVNTRDPSYISK